MPSSIPTGAADQWSYKAGASTRSGAPVGKGWAKYWHGWLPPANAAARRLLGQRVTSRVTGCEGVAERGSAGLVRVEWADGRCYWVAAGVLTAGEQPGERVIGDMTNAELQTLRLKHDRAMRRSARALDVVEAEIVRRTVKANEQVGLGV